MSIGIRSIVVTWMINASDTFFHALPKLVPCRVSPASGDIAWSLAFALLLMACMIGAQGGRILLRLRLYCFRIGAQPQCATQAAQRRPCACRADTGRGASLRQGCAAGDGPQDFCFDGIWNHKMSLVDEFE